MMPPEMPDRNLKTAHLYRLLRPEFVKGWHTPLCSDGFSSFIKHHNPSEHNRELARATKHLRQVTIPHYAPQFACELMEKVRALGWRSLELVRVSEALHRQGI